jgi:mRNA interferase RelE/StbE
MKYKIETSKLVKKFLQKHPEIISKYFSAIELLQYNPNTPDLDIKKLQGEKYSYRLRIGKYRFLYEIKEEKILIYFFDAGSRGDIYK